MKINNSTNPVSWFNERNIEKRLILKPPYQRKPVWTEPQKSYLIDTILNDYIIPEIYIHRVSDSTGGAIYNIIDGQQRIRSILEFLNDEFPINAEDNPELADYVFSDLPQSYKLKFFDYTIYVREITNASEDEVKNLFRRMNKNVVALNSQELRHATYSGDFIKTMEEIAEDEFWAINKIVTPNEIRRMNDVQYISDLFISMIHGIQDKTKEMEKYYEYYEKNGFKEKSQYIKKFWAIITMIGEILPELRNSRWRNKSDFYTLLIAINKISETKYIPQDKYSNLRNSLLDFSEQINKVARKESKGSKSSKEIAQYVNAVTKSTTDRDRRIIRHKIILKILLKYSKEIKS